MSERRGAHEPELELEDTGAFEGNRYFDVFVEWAKDGPEDLVLCVVLARRREEADAFYAELWQSPSTSMTSFAEGTTKSAM